MLKDHTVFTEHTFFESIFKTLELRLSIALTLKQLPNEQASSLCERKTMAILTPGHIRTATLNSSKYHFITRIFLFKTFKHEIENCYCFKFVFIFCRIFFICFRVFLNTILGFSNLPILKIIIISGFLMILFCTATSVFRKLVIVNNKEMCSLLSATKSSLFHLLYFI